MRPHEFFDRFQPVALAVAVRVAPVLRRHGFEPEDAAQEAARRVWQVARCDVRRGRVLACANPEGWVAQAVRRLLLRIGRAKRPLLAPIEDTLAERLAAPGGGPDEVEVERLLRAAPRPVAKFIRGVLEGTVARATGGRAGWDTPRRRATKWLTEHLEACR